MRLASRITLAIAANAVFAVGAVYISILLVHALGLRESATWGFALLIVLPMAMWSGRWAVRDVSRMMQGLDDGLRAFRDGDFSMRLASRTVDETSAVKRLYNEVADVLRAQRNDVYQKELLLDTILQRTPVGVVLTNHADRVVYSNVSARELFADGGRIDGYHFAELLERVAEPIRDALAGTGDAIVTIRGEDQDETFHISQRTFRLNTQEHRLVLAERLTAELRRQEVNVWKQAIRVMNHEINNTIAPISSLFHSARIAQEQPDRRHKLVEIYETIDERLGYLRAFLESYAQFARLPEPRRERTRWQEILDDVRALYRFRVEGDPESDAFVDRAQMQQVLINLVKNAHESGSAPEDVVVSVRRGPDATIVRVSDAGRGMTESVLRQALIPFYTTKPSGTGVGLALSNEIVEAHGGRMRLQARAGGGTVVTCWLPD